MFPFYKQLDSSDCGAACLRMILKYYGKHFTSETIRAKAFTSREGTSFLGLKQAAESFGMEAYALQLDWEAFCKLIKTPCIIHWNQNHFIVVYKVKHNRFTNNTTIYVANPGKGILPLSKEEFLAGWLHETENKGFVLVMEPTEAFYQLKEEKESSLTFRYLLRYIRPFRTPIIQFFLAMLLGSLISLAFPFLTQAMVDQGIKEQNLNLILLLLIAQLLLTLGQLGNDMIRSWLMLHVTMRVNISFISDFLYKLMRLPISFFDVKRVGDIMQRISDNSRIQSFLTHSLISIVIAAITFIVYSFVMAGYNLNLLIIFFIGSILYIGWTFLFLKKRKKLDYARFEKSANNQSKMVQLITGMQEIKLNSCERPKLWEWERIQTDIYRVTVRSTVLEQVQSIGGTCIDQIKNIIISYWAARMVVEGEMTLGMMMAMQYVIGQLNAPIGQFMGFVQSAQDASISMERMGEIYNMEEEEPEEISRIHIIPSNGRIEFKNVDFHYEGPASPKVLNQLNFTVLPGKVNAIVGVSGSGKTTIMKLLLGYYHPSCGQISLNGKDLWDYSSRAWRGACGTVMQEGFIFSDTIERNICMQEGDVDKDRLKYALHVANIESYIDSLPLGLNTQIGMEGNGMSSGQKQRILIARAVYKNPDYILLDEATNSLDSNNEQLILERMQTFYQNKTVVVIAHRLSTIRHADNIIVLNNGQVAESGKHEELLACKGLYYELINKQLDV